MTDAMTTAPTTPDAAPRPFLASLALTHAVEAFDSQIAVLVPGEVSAGAVSVVHLTAEPFSGPPLHVHTREDELIHVLSGTVGFMCEDERWTAGPGTIAYLPKGRPHTWANLGEKHARLLVICQPGGFESFLSEAGLRHLDPVRDAAELAELGERHGLRALGPNPLLAHLNPSVAPVPTHPAVHQG